MRPTKERLKCIRDYIDLALLDEDIGVELFEEIDALQKELEDLKQCPNESWECAKEIKALSKELEAVKSERDDLKNLHSRTVALVFPDERDSPGAYRKLLRDVENERDSLKMSLDAALHGLEEIRELTNRSRYR